MLFPFFHKKAQPGIWVEPELLQSPPVYEKLYPRFKKVPLPQSVDMQAELERTMRARSSAHSFDPARTLMLADLSSILWGAAERPTPKAGNAEMHYRNYPSGGGLVPLEIYVLARNVEGLAHSAYHYNPITHDLSELSAMSEDLFTSVLRYPFTHDAAALVVVSAVWSRSTLKYEELAYRLAHLEAGHMVQNLLLLATKAKVVSRPLAGVVHEKLEKFLDFEGSDESIIYAAVFGH